MSQKEEPGTGPQQPPTTADDLWEDDVDEPVGEVTAASESVEVLADLVSDPARAAVAAERLVSTTSRLVGPRAAYAEPYDKVTPRSKTKSL